MHIHFFETSSIIDCFQHFFDKILYIYSTFSLQTQYLHLSLLFYTLGFLSVNNILLHVP